MGEETAQGQNTQKKSITRSATVGMKIKSRPVKGEQMTQRASCKSTEHTLKQIAVETLSVGFLAETGNKKTVILCILKLFPEVSLKCGSGKDSDCNGWSSD